MSFQDIHFGLSHAAVQVSPKKPVCDRCDAQSQGDAILNIVLMGPAWKQISEESETESERCCNENRK